MSIFRDPVGVLNIKFCFQILLTIPFLSQTHRSGRIVVGVRGTKGIGLEREFSVWDYLTQEKSSGWEGRVQ